MLKPVCSLCFQYDRIKQYTDFRITEGRQPSFLTDGTSFSLANITCKYNLSTPRLHQLPRSSIRISDG